MNSEERVRIPGGKQRNWRHLIPLASLLIERGHPNFDEECEYGFFPVNGGFQCQLGRALTDEDWAAIRERFVLPDSIVFFNGMISDNENRIDIIGVAGFTEDGEYLTFDEWEDRERRGGRL